MNSKDWAQIYTPLITELLRAVVGLIFGKEETRTQIVHKYKGGTNESNRYNADYYNSSSGSVRW